MPELPEVETVRLQLLKHLTGRTITAITVHHPKSVGSDGHFSHTIKGQTIEHIDRIGKLLIVHFVDTDNLFLLAHLKMTGQFLCLDSQGNLGGGGHTLTPGDTQLPNRHTRITFTLDNGARLFFNDMRLFGYVKVATKEEMEQARRHFGPEPISSQFDTTHFINGLHRRTASIKAVLLDQTFIAGLGNIYVDETLFAANVCPTRAANTLTTAEAAAIAAAAGSIMKAAIAVGGTTFQHFVDTGGDHGNYSDHLQVFGKQGTPCPRCGSTITKIRCAGRGTHYCPGCQQ